jgi:hypothetical protein
MGKDKTMERLRIYLEYGDMVCTKVRYTAIIPPTRARYFQGGEK